MTAPRTDLSTHLVENQPARFWPNLWADRPLQNALDSLNAPVGPVASFARALSDPGVQEAGRAANRNPPELRLFDSGGRRLDEVGFHPSYHDLMHLGLSEGYSALAWEDAPGGHVAHAAMVYLMSQVEPGVCCPMTMTYAAIPVIRASPDIATQWLPKLLSRQYDPAISHISNKRGATLGMAMTEKQGGSDVRSNTTTAVRDGDAYRITGHKWFCSAPMSDGFLTLANTENGLTCFLVPRWLEDGRNSIQLMRLKDKLGNRANASAEIEYHDTLAYCIGEEGQGVRTIIEMVHHTRLDTAMAPAGLMRAALVQALHWCQNRTAFQKRLIDQPLMRVVLADLSLDVEGALALGLRVAAAYDEPNQRPFARIAVALAKFLSNKRAPNVIYEALEALGGMGYVEDTALPLLYREAPLNSIWEGSGNVICLDILRTLHKEKDAAEALEAALVAPKGRDPAYDTALSKYLDEWKSLPSEAQARRFAVQSATLLTAATLLGSENPVAADYCAARLGEGASAIAGGSKDIQTDLILSRATSVA